VKEKGRVTHRLFGVVVLSSAGFSCGFAFVVSGAVCGTNVLHTRVAHGLGLQRLVGISTTDANPELFAECPQLDVYPSDQSLTLLLEDLERLIVHRSPQSQ
jgi:hypothetical protein